jgi:hypothetical protein
MYDYNGERMTFGELAAIAKVSPSVLGYRIHRLHWPVADAVEKPPMTAAQAGRRGKDAAIRLHALR